MDKHGHVYELTEEQQKSLELIFTTQKEKEAVEIREDVARLEGYRLGQGRGRIGGRGSNSDLAG